MKLAFSTLGCPNWSLEKIVEEAAKNGYDGVEFRGLRDEIYLPRAPEFASERKREVRRLFKKNRLEIACLDTSSQLSSQGAEWQKHFTEAKECAMLARDLGAPFIRVFGGKAPEGMLRDQIMALAATHLREICEVSCHGQVKVALETHDYFTSSRDVAAVLEKADCPGAVALWDLNHPYRASKEEPEETMANLGRFLGFVHVKDTGLVGQGLEHRLLGEGDLPWKKMVSLIKQAGYPGYLSFEWEKRWAKDIPEPEVAIPHYAKVMRQYLETK